MHNRLLFGIYDSTKSKNPKYIIWQTLLTNDKLISKIFKLFSLFRTTTGWWWSRPEQRLQNTAPAWICASWDLLVPRSWQTLSGLAQGPGSSHPATTKSDPPGGASHVRCRLLAWLSRDRKEKKKRHLNLLIFTCVYK